MGVDSMLLNSIEDLFGRWWLSIDGWINYKVIICLYTCTGWCQITTTCPATISSFQTMEGRPPQPTQGPSAFIKPTLPASACLTQIIAFKGLGPRTRWKVSVNSASPKVNNPINSAFAGWTVLINSDCAKVNSLWTVPSHFYGSPLTSNRAPWKLSLFGRWNSAGI